MLGFLSWHEHSEVTCCRPMINKPPPLNRDQNRDPNMKALKRKGFMNQGSILLEIPPLVSQYVLASIWGGPFMTRIAGVHEWGRGACFL